ncbi:MAG: flagellar basal body rod protein FlgC [Candidatus Latescibacteria bacterium]|nr:flagellar basal body rod protein FlgC [Candidatus Latescibacterota bacterium]
MESLFRGNIYRSIDIAASGMTAQRKRLDAISSNIANMSVTNVDGNGNPYLRKQVVMKSDPEKPFPLALNNAMQKMKHTRHGHISEVEPLGKGKKITPLVEGEEIDIPNMKNNVVYDPSHPDANAEGYVTYPDINIVEEMVDMMVANRAFDANITVINSAKQMISRSLEI